MQAAIQFKAEPRKESGKGASRALRRHGRTPLVMYAGGKDSIHANVDTNELTLAIGKGGFLSKIVGIEIEGKTHFGIAREVQRHPVSDKIEHVDFQQIDKASEVKVSIPVHVFGAEKSPGIKRGGVLNVVAHSLTLLSKVANIPASIDIDVSELDIGSSIHLSDVKLPEGVKPASKRVDVTIVSISGRVEEKEEVATAATAEGATSVEGAAATTEGTAAGAAPAGDKAAPAKK